MGHYLHYTLTVTNFSYPLAPTPIDDYNVVYYMTGKIGTDITYRGDLYMGQTNAVVYDMKFIDTDIFEKGDTHSALDIYFYSGNRITQEFNVVKALPKSLDILSLMQTQGEQAVIQEKDQSLSFQLTGSVATNNSIFNCVFTTKLIPIPISPVTDYKFNITVSFVRSGNGFIPQPVSDYRMYVGLTRGTTDVYKGNFPWDNTSTTQIYNVDALTIGQLQTDILVLKLGFYKVSTKEFIQSFVFPNPIQISQVILSEAMSAYLYPDQNQQVTQYNFQNWYNSADAGPNIFTVTTTAISPLPPVPPVPTEETEDEGLVFDYERQAEAELRVIKKLQETMVAMNERRNLFITTDFGQPRNVQFKAYNDNNPVSTDDTQKINLDEHGYPQGYDYTDQPYDQLDPQRGNLDYWKKFDPSLVDVFTDSMPNPLRDSVKYQGRVHQGYSQILEDVDNPYDVLKYGVGKYSLGHTGVNLLNHIANSLHSTGQLPKLPMSMNQASLAQQYNALVPGNDFTEVVLPRSDSEILPLGPVTEKLLTLYFENSFARPKYHQKQIDFRHAFDTLNQEFKALPGPKKADIRYWGDDIGAITPWIQGFDAEKALLLHPNKSALQKIFRNDLPKQIAQKMNAFMSADFKKRDAKALMKDVFRTLPSDAQEVYRALSPSVQKDIIVSALQQVYPTSSQLVRHAPNQDTESILQSIASRSTQPSGTQFDSEVVSDALRQIIRSPFLSVGRFAEGLYNAGSQVYQHMPNDMSLAIAQLLAAAGQAYALYKSTKQLRSNSWGMALAKLGVGAASLYAIPQLGYQPQQHNDGLDPEDRRKIMATIAYEAKRAKQQGSKEIAEGIIEKYYLDKPQFTPPFNLPALFYNLSEEIDKYLEIIQRKPRVTEFRDLSINSQARQRMERHLNHQAQQDAMQKLKSVARKAFSAHRQKSPMLYQYDTEPLLGKRRNRNL